jgi:hypothetical protein
MQQEKRHHEEPVPNNYDDIVSAAQLATIEKLEAFGWTLFFIRRSAEVIPILRCPLSSECYTAMVNKDGSVVRNHGLALREGDKRLN